MVFQLTNMNINKRVISDLRREIVLFIVYPFLELTILILRFIPKKWRNQLAIFVGNLSYKSNKKTRDYTLKHLTIGYGDIKSPEEIDSMAREVLININKSVIDYFATAHITNRKKFFKLIDVVGEEHLKKAYEQKRGVICLIPHLSSWEFSAVTPPMLGYKTCGASKNVKGFLLQHMMVRFRERRGMRNISREGSYQKLVTALQNGECLIIMIDQDTKVKGLFVDFYGKKAYTPMGVARLALETDAVVLPMATTRITDSNYRFTIYPELKTIRTGDTEKDLYDNTQLETDAMEKIIRESPTQWVWMHRRWSTTPESLKNYLERRAINKQNKAK